MGKKVDDKTLLEIASKVGYNTNKTENNRIKTGDFIEVPKGSGKHFKVVDDGSQGPGHTNSGFDAMVMQEVDGPGQDAKPISDPIMVIEGSNTLDPNAEKGPNGRPNDMKESDVPLGMGKTPQSYHDAEAYFQYLKERGIDIKQVTGNSLGGGHGTYLGMLHPELDVVVSNPAPVPDELLGNGKGSGANIRVVRTSSDPLSILNNLAGLHTPGMDITVRTSSIAIATQMVIVKTPDGKYKIVNLENETKRIWAMMGINSKEEYDALSEERKKVINDKVSEELGKLGTPLWYAHLGFSSQNPGDNMPQDITNIAPFSMLTGKALSKNDASFLNRFFGNTKIEIGYRELATVATSLKSQQMGKIETIEQLITSANELVRDEKNRLVQRKEFLERNYTETVKVILGREMLLEQIDKLKFYLEKASEEIDKYANEWYLHEIVKSSKLRAKMIIVSAGMIIRNIEESIKKQAKEIQEQVDDSNGIIDGSEDAIAAALKTYYSIIPESVDVVQANVRKLSDSIINTANTMEATDESLRKMISEAKLSNDNIDIIKENNDVQNLLKSDNVIMAKAILNSKQELLENNFKNIQKLIESLIHDIVDGANILIESATHFLNDIINKLTIVSINVGAAINLAGKTQDLNNTIETCRMYLNKIAPMKKLLRNIENKTPSTINQLKPALSVAIFGDDKLAEIITFQEMALDIMASLKIVFADLTNHLSYQKGESIRALSQVGEDVSRSLDSLEEQILVLVMTE